MSKAMSVVPIKRLALVMLAMPALIAAAPASTPPRPGPPPTPAQVKAAEQTLGIIVSALRAPNVPAQVKSTLFGCLYQVPLGAISAAMTDTLGKNPKLNKTDPNILLGVVAGVCGFRPGPGTAPAKPQSK